MVRVGADTKDMEKGLKTARAKMKAFGNQMKKIGKVAAVAGAAIVGAVGVMVRSYIKAGDEVHKMALRTGFSTEALSELNYAAQISGATLETLEKGVKKMSKTINDATKAGGAMATYVRAFEQLGLNAEELIELNAEEAFEKISRAIANIESPMVRAARAQDIFGRAGTQLLPLFAAGAEGLDDLRKKAHELGIVFDQEAANKAAKLTDAITTLKGAIKGTSMSIAGELVPVLTVLVEAATQAMTDIRGDAKTMTSSLLSFFKLIAQGIMTLMLAFYEFQRGVFQMGAGIVMVLREYVGKLIMGYGALATIIPAFRDNVAELMEVYKNLYIVEKGYIGLQEEQIDKQTGVIIAFEKLFKALEDADKGYKKAGQAITETLPVFTSWASAIGIIFQGVLDNISKTGRGMSDILGSTVTEMTSDFYGLETAWQDTMYEVLAGVSNAAGAMDSVFSQLHANEAMRIENEQKQQTDAIESWFEQERAKLEQTIMNEEEKVAALEALDEEKARKENELQHRMDKEKRKLARKEAKAKKVSALFAAGMNVAEAITKALTAGPLIGQIFAGIVAALGAVQMAAIAAAPLPSLAKGGMIEKEGIYRLHPGEEVRSAAAVKTQMGPSTFSPTVNIYTKYLDDRAINQAAEKILRRLDMERGRY